MLAKLVAPSVDKAFLRKNLLKRFDLAVNKKILWLNAAAGSGKTTLIASYLNQHEMPHIWYQLDESDSDPATFFYYFAQAMQAHGNKSIDPPLLTAENLTRLPNFARQYFRELARQIVVPLIFVFDDCQAIPSDCVLHEVISIAAVELPENCLIVITSRTPPPEIYARLQMYNEMVVIGGDEFLLSPMEMKEFCHTQYGSHLTQALINNIYEQTHGWFTGVSLLMNHIDTKNIVLDKTSLSNNSLLAEYFSAEIFSRLSPEAQKLSLQLALLPRFTQKIIDEFVLDDNIKSDLFLQIIQNQFVSVQGSENKIYQFHPLYRDYMRVLLKKSSTHEKYQSYLKQAGQLLLKNNSIEDAAELFKKSDDLSELSYLITLHAGQLISQGRYQTLQSWFESFSNEIISDTSWLSYWYAVSLTSYDLNLARHYFELAFVKFREENDTDGSLMAWAGVVQTYHYLWGSFEPLDYWIKVLGDILPSQTEALSTQLEWQIVTGMFSSLVTRQPDNPDIIVWRQRTENLVFYHDDVNRQLDLASKLMLHYLWQGDMEQARHLANRISPGVHKASPIYILYWWHIEATYYWLSADFERAMKVVQDSAEMMDEHGIIGHHFFTMGQAVYTLLSRNTANDARPYLERMQASIVPGSPLHQSHYYYLAAYYSALVGDFKTARVQINISVDIANNCGAVLTIVMAELAVAFIECEQGNISEALLILDKNDPVITRTGSAMLAFRAGVVRTHILLLQNNEPEAVKILSETFATSADAGMVNFDWWFDKVMSRLCAFALRNKIQSEYVCRLIRLRKLSPEVPSIEFEAWPWSVRIFTLKNFALLCDDIPVAFSGKAQKKTLNLLKAIIAFGGSDIRESKLQDALWPDTEGDQAKQNLKATVHRLRKLMGSISILWYEGKITLNQKVCWVDVWALERQLDILLEQLPMHTHDDMKQATTILKHYPGKFLLGEDESYVLGMRERLRSKVLRLLEKMANRLCHGQSYHDAITVYQAALEIEPLVEPLYQGLMRSYIALGLNCEARTVYERCRKNLVVLLNLTPSEETEHLAKNIK